MKRSFCGAAILLAAALGACSRDGQEQAAATAPPEPVPAPARILETFEVGQDVYVRALAADPDAGALWVGTSLGVHEIDLDTREVRKTYTRGDGLANEYVFSVLVDSAGDKWFGTNGGGVTRLRGAEWKTWFPMHGLADYWVYALAEDPGAGIWIGTWAGVNRLPAEGGAFETYHDELVNEWVYGIGVDSRRRAWFGTEGGVSMFDGERWREWTHADGLGAPNRDKLPLSSNTGLGTRARHDLSVLVDGQASYNPNYVFCIHVGKDDRVWAGTWGGGVSRFDGERWSNLSTADGLAGNIVFAVAEDARGNLWFGTDQGLSRYDGSAWQTFRRADGLPGEAVYALEATAAGEVWAGTRGGVARIGD
ncbi:MAG: regulator [Gammaproteobacteria bacterium]|nr:regulator [Gammaproteobacteria bacterium]